MEPLREPFVDDPTLRAVATAANREYEDVLREDLGKLDRPAFQRLVRSGALKAQVIA